MNRIYLTLISLSIISISCFAQYDTIIHSGQVNVALLKLNYYNYSFEGGVMEYLDCPACSIDSIPFDVVYDSPSDFGSICLRLDPSLDTIFRGSIVWAGSGSINYPTFFGTDMPFSLGNSIVSSPNTIQYLDPEGYTMTSPTAISDAYQCWNEIANYEITKVFSNNGFRAAIFLYTPSVGATNYNMAKWIVLLYHQEGMLNLPNLNASDVICTPNPFNESIQINTDLNGLDYKICSSSGEILKSGKCFDGNIDGLSHFSSGLYFLEVVRNEQTTIRKLIKN